MPRLASAIEGTADIAAFFIAVGENWKSTEKAVSGTANRNGVLEDDGDGAGETSGEDESEHG